LYNKVIINAIDYIKLHLEEELTVEDIAEHCHFSKFYFNRLFKSIVGESVYAFIKRLRIEKSAFCIRYEFDKTITEIGAQYGYSSSNYSTAFKKHYGQSPASFKKNITNSKVLNPSGIYYADLTDKTFNDYDKNMKLIELEDFEVIYQRFIGNYHNHSDYWEEFKRRYGNYIEEDSWCLDISYDDPVVTEENRCISDICITTSKPIRRDCTTMIIEGGHYMVYAFEGSATKIFETFQSLFGIWMVETPLTIDLGTRKMISRYREIDKENKHLSIDIYIPVY